MEEGEERSVMVDERGPKMYARAPRMEKSGLNMGEKGLSMGKDGVNIDGRGPRADERGKVYERAPRMDGRGLNMDGKGLRAEEINPKLSERMKPTYSTELPAKTSQTTAPIYASVDDPNSLLPKLESHSASVAAGTRYIPNRDTSAEMVEVDPRNRMGDQRYRMEQRPRFNTDSFVSQGPRRYNHPKSFASGNQLRTKSATHLRTETGTQGRTGSEFHARPGVGAQRSAVQPNSVQADYPTARFGKDYYVIDV